MTFDTSHTSKILRLIEMKFDFKMDCTGKILGSKNGFDILECTVCGYAHSFPYPDPSLIEKVYTEEYFSDVKPNYIKSMEEDLDWWNINYDQRYDILEDNLEKKDLF